jgi:hypothetical protein
MNNMTIKTKNGDYNISREGFIRWLCLLEIVEKTEEKARELKVNLDNIDWVKPVAFKKYMSERFKSMEIDLDAEEGGISRNLDYNPLNNIPRIQEYHSQTYQTQTSLIQNQDLEDTIHHV